VSLSPSAATERVRRLESTGVVTASMAHLEQLVNELTQFGSTTTNLVYSQTLPYRGPQGPGANI
jgi:DNA-binding Lrp family transcriptional regulator